MRTWRSPAPILLAASALLVSGCGDGDGDGASAGFKKSGTPAPRECVERYNANQEATNLGLHAYGEGHDSRAAHVFRITGAENDLDRSCAVIFAAAESDREYGTLGGIEYPGAGWDYTTRLSVTPQKRAEIQRLGAEQANVALESDGTLSVFE